MSHLSKKFIEKYSTEYVKKEGSLIWMDVPVNFSGNFHR